PLFVAIHLSGPIDALLFPDDAGNFTFIRLPVGQYTVTPIDVSFNFNPSSRSVNISNADVTGIDFVGTFVPANITGHVTDDNGAPLANIVIRSVGGFPQGETLTDSNGNYSFPNVARHRTYSISPNPFGAYSFRPDSVLLPDLISSQAANFVGVPKPANN